MYNWSTNVAKLKKDKKKFSRWRLEQLINFGLSGERLSRRALEGKLKNLEIDPKKKKFLKLLLNEK